MKMMADGWGRYVVHDHAPVKKTRRDPREPEPEPSYYILAKRVDNVVENKEGSVDNGKESSG